MLEQVRVLLALALLTAVPLEPAIAATSSRQDGAVAHDGPFGIGMGEPLGALGRVRPIEPGLYAVAAPPRPSLDFDEVSVTAFPETGVCMITGKSSNRIDSGGSEMRATVDRIADVLVQKYGPYESKTDYCDGAADVCSNDWVTQLNNQHAEHSYLWTFAKTPRSDDIGGILLEVGALDGATSYARITYMSAKSMNACTAGMNRGEGSSL